MSFYDDLRTHRETARLSINDLARLADINADTIRRAEKHKPCRKLTLLKLVDALNSHHYNRNGGPLVHEMVIKEESKYGGHRNPEMNGMEEDPE